MKWFHTIALPLATMFGLFVGVQKKSPAWKQGALVVGCSLMLGGLWLTEAWSTILLIAGGALFLLGVPRGVAIARGSSSHKEARNRNATESGDERGSSSKRIE
jgi:hypothetical protein